MDEDQEFIAPDNGGWHYTIMRDWIAVCPDIGPTAARLYWIIRSIMHEKGERARRLSHDQLCYLLPGVNGKPTGETRVKDALRELEAVGLLSNPDGDVVRRWVADPKTGKQRKDNFRRWKIHDYPDGNYIGWRSAIAKLDAYTEDWRNRLSTESRKSDPQSSDKPATSNNGSSSQLSTESRKSDPTRRKSDPTRRKSGGDKPLTSANDVTKNLSKESPQPTNGTHPVDTSNLVGWLGASPEEKTNDTPDTAGARLLREWGVTRKAIHDWAAIVDDGFDKLGEKAARQALTDDLAGVTNPAGAIVGHRLPALRDRLSAPRATPPAQTQGAAWPNWCGHCDKEDRREIRNDGRPGKRCQRCHRYPDTPSPANNRAQQRTDEQILDALTQVDA